MSKISNKSFKEIPAGEIASQSDIKPGMIVFHAKFGEGEVIEINGGDDNRIARIQFKDLEGEEKHIVLRFAKLKILV
ncbi:MAG: hypothetical protein IPH57_09015 [Saprospiraceae bacterium]|nr:hypothetical protein [Saprospiraceae bacterium]